MISYLQLSTLVVWSACLAGGAVGMMVPYARPREAVSEPPTIQAEVLQVELSQEMVLPPASSPQQVSMLTPPPPEAMEAPSITPILAVAAPNASMAFALPVEGPAIVVEKAQASFTRPVEVPQVVPTPIANVRTLTFGQGEGKQPAPEYPYKAMKEGQEGAVLVQFTVDEMGKVVSAEPVRQSPWSLLNQAAVKVIRERWRFQPGALRRYEVTIRFQLN